MRRVLRCVHAIVAAACLSVPVALAGPVHWAHFPDNVAAGPVFKVPLSGTSSVDVQVLTGGSQGLTAVSSDSLGALATGLDYDSLHVLAIFNGGGPGSVSTTITFSNFQLGANHQRGCFLVGAVNGLSSPVTLSAAVPGRVSTWTTVGGTFDYGPLNAFAITWDAVTGTFHTTAPIGIDSRCIVLDLGPLASNGTITVSLSQALVDGIVFALGEELGATTSIEPGPAVALALAPARPNPARGGVVLDFSLAAAGRATLTAFDVSGRRLASLADQEFEAGSHSLAWDLRDDAGRPLPPGLVFVTLRTEQGTRAQRVLVAR